ncbi:MAG: mechanosensitive ion channel family protein [Micropruina sp.]|nr:mechanosensitive ion channel family protein [Micropruina sp.]
MTPLAIEWIWPDTPLAILITLVVAIAGRWLLLRAVKRGTDLAVDRANQRRTDQGQDDAALYAARHSARAATMGSLLRSVINAAVAVLAVLTVMAILNIPLTPILASAGVGGVALGFGAQSLVRDYLSGIFMIVEDQYGVGDLVDLGEASGTIEDVGLRVTRLRDAGGQVWYIRNGEIVRVGNKSQGWSTATIDIPVDSSENSTRVIEVLTGICAEVYADPEWSQVLLEQPTVAGVQSVEAGRMTIRITARTAPNQHWRVQRAILDRELQALKDAGIKGPRMLPTPPPAQ